MREPLVRYSRLAGMRSERRTQSGCYARAVPVHRDRSRVHEARISGLAISLSLAALILVLVYVVGGYANRVVIEIVRIPAPAASTR